MTENARLKLYTYWRSSAAYRVRIALNLKGLAYEAVPVHLARGEHRGDYAHTNPQQLVPALEHDGLVVIQSLAIIEYLDETFMGPRLIPSAPRERARVNALAQIVACDIHPLNNLRVINFLVDELGVAERQKLHWYRHWVAQGFAALERLLDDPATGAYCHGEQPTLADACLIPQVYNARRFDCDLSPYPTICRIETQCLENEAFVNAAPANQPDAG